MVNTQSFFKLRLSRFGGGGHKEIMYSSMSRNKLVKSVIFPVPDPPVEDIMWSCQTVYKN